MYDIISLDFHAFQCTWSYWSSGFRINVCAGFIATSIFTAFEKRAPADLAINSVAEYTLKLARLVGVLAPFALLHGPACFVSHCKFVSPVDDTD